MHRCGCFCVSTCGCTEWLRLKLAWASLFTRRPQKHDFTSAMQLSRKYDFYPDEQMSTRCNVVGDEDQRSINTAWSIRKRNLPERQRPVNTKWSSAHRNSESCRKPPHSRFLFLALALTPRGTSSHPCPSTYIPVDERSINGCGIRAYSTHIKPLLPGKRITSIKIELLRIRL